MTEHHDFRSISELNAKIEQLKIAVQTFSDLVEHYETTVLVDDDGDAIPLEQQEELNLYRQKLAESNRALVRLHQARDQQTMKEVTTSSLIDRYSDRLSTYLISLPGFEERRFKKRLESVGLLLNDPNFLWTNLSTLFTEAERQEYKSSRRIEETQGRHGAKFDTYFRRKLKKAKIEMPQSQFDWQLLLSAMERLQRP